MRYYLDSNVLISYLKQELGMKYQLQFPRVIDFFSKCSLEKHTIVLSPLFFKEVKKIAYATKEEVVELFTASLDIPIDCINDVDEIKPFSRQIETCGVHYPDSKHVAYAIFSNSDLLITWNKKDFEIVEERIPVLTPYEAV